MMLMITYSVLTLFVKSQCEHDQTRIKIQKCIIYFCGPEQMNCIYKV